MKNKKLSMMLLCCFLSVSALTACTSSAPAANNGTLPLNPLNTVSGSNAPAPTGIDAQLKLTQGGWNNIEWTTYSDQYVTLQVPKGWKVETKDLYQGGTTGSGTGVFVKSPDESVLTEYIDFVSVPSFSLKSPTIESFFTDVVAANDSTITSFVITSSAQSDQQKQFAADNPNAYVDGKTLSADSVVKGKSYEGYYSATMIDNNSSLTGLYGVITAVDMAAPKGELNNWVNILVQIQNSIKLNQSRYSAGSVVGSSSYSGSGSSISDGIMDSWNKRNQSEDILSQKRSDATLGYERVYDTYTGDIYRANNGFYDSYSAQGGQRYSPISDDMYDDGYSGYLSF